MKLKKIIEEDLSHYKDYVLLLFAPKCNWKCCVEQNICVSECANFTHQSSPTIEFSNEEILDAFASNSLHSAVCLAGAEPLDSDDIIEFMEYFRAHRAEPIIVYTGYDINEINVTKFVGDVLKNKINDVILKVGRYIKNGKKHVDSILGVCLIGENQYSIKIN